jgi:ferric-dicitrate binding protein FerR (iron transport regulator)
MWVAAASIVMVLSVSVFLIMGKNKPNLTIAGSPTQQLHILGDGTTVALKENSTVTYDPLLENKKTREVWLKGSAEFNVKHKPDNKLFVVHTDWFDIEVTGTSFSAINNSDQASVLLTEGSISLLLHNGSRVNMKPGDFYEAKNTGNTIVGREEIALEKKIVFDNLPFEEVARMVEERYGIKIEITSATLSKRRITGALPNDNLDVLIGALEVATDCQIVKRTNLLIINEAN